MGTPGTLTHKYPSLGNFQMKIRGDFPRIYMSATSATNNAKLRSINQWGDIQWMSMEYAFINATNLQILATDTPNLSKVTSMYGMFYNATNLTGNFSGWDTSKVTNMSYMFYNAANFNQDISSRIVHANSNFTYFLSGVNLSSYNYNALLDSRSRQS
ncbi:MAG: DUF285 domain-containing protein [Candidatus Peribacteria bacterium]|jgi:surface protein|nr:DUF285 domain-containing protein [Candidatus Peribacteria bacterium]